MGMEILKLLPPASEYRVDVRAWVSGAKDRALKTVLIWVHII